MATYNILMMGASYGSLLASKILFGGHKVHLVCLPAEADREFDQLGRRRRCAPGRRLVCRAVQCLQRFRVCAGGCQRHVPGPQFRHPHGLRQRPVDGTALGASRVGVDALRQQGMGESHAAVVNCDDALGFCVGKRFDGRPGDLSE